MHLHSSGFLSQCGIASPGTKLWLKYLHTKSLFSRKPVTTSVLCHWTVVRCLLVLWPFSRADLTVSEADLLRSPLLPACLILHATGISSIDHGCRSVCRCLHRSVSLITHSHSSAGLLISARPLSLCLPFCSYLSLSLPLVPLLSPFSHSLSFAFSHTFF